jgi:hypothetical protein
MTSSITDGSIVQEIGAPPPFDPELVPIAEMLAGIRPPDAYRLDTIEQMRAPVPGVEAPTDEVLTRGGTYRVEERIVPGPDGHPDISLLICLPIQVSAVRLWQAGARAELHVWPGGFHGFDVVAPHAALSRDAVAVRAAWLRRQLGG